MAVRQATGNDLLNYTGNAGLAAGASNGLSPITDNPLSGVNKALDDVLAYNQYKREQDYKRKLEGQDKLMELMSGSDGSLFNMADGNGKNISHKLLPEDTDYVLNKAHERRNYAMSHKDTYRFDPEYGRMTDEYNNLVAQAGHRADAYAAYDEAARNATSEAQRQRIKAAQKEQVDTSISEGKRFNPYMPEIQYNPNDLFDSKLNTEANRTTFNVTSGTDNQGNLVHTSKSGIDGNVFDFRSKVGRNTKEYNSALGVANDYLESIANDPQKALAHQANIDKINRERGWADANGNPINPHYIPRVAKVVFGEDGQQHVVPVTNNPLDIAYAVMGHDMLPLEAATDIKKDAHELAKEDLENEGTAADTAYKKGQTAHLGDEKTKALTPQEIADQHATDTTIKRITPIFSSANYQGSGTPIVRGINKDGSSEYRKVEGVDIAPIFKEKGFDPKDWGVFKKPTWADASDLSGVERIVEKTEGEQRTGETAPSDRILFFKNNKTGDIRIGFFKKEDKGDDYTMQSFVNGREAVGNAAKHKHQYKGENAKLSEEITRNEAAWDNQDMKTSTQSKSTGDIPPAIKALGKVLKSRKAPNGKTYYRIEGNPGIFREDGTDGSNDTF